MTTARDDPRLTGVLRLTWVTDNLEHVMTHSQSDEPVGIWTGLACPAHGLPIGADVDIATLQHLAQGVVVDLVWEAPADFTEEHGRLLAAAVRAYHSNDHQTGEHLWQQAQALWASARAASAEALTLMQHAGLTRFSPHKPQRWVIASYDHHRGPHGVNRPHVHNIAIPVLTIPAG
jgi:hypothetical protein